MAVKTEIWPSWRYSVCSGLMVLEHLYQRSLHGLTLDNCKDDNAINGNKGRWRGIMMRVGARWWIQFCLVAGTDP